MGSVGLGNTAALGAFLNKTYQEGLDLGRCQINQALGVFVASPTNTFRAGMLVAKGTDGLLIPSVGTDVLGVAKWNHTTALLALSVDEPFVISGTAANLAHGTISNLKVSATVGGAAATITTDYTTSLANGTVTKAGGGAFTNGQTVYATYQFQIAASDLMQLQGQNFWNNVDEVSQADGRCTVITDATVIFTSQYDTSRQYAVTGSGAAGSDLYASGANSNPAGYFTNDSTGSAVFVGRCIQVPTATDPYLGVMLARLPVAV